MAAPSARSAQQLSATPGLGILDFSEFTLPELLAALAVFISRLKTNHDLNDSEVDTVWAIHHGNRTTAANGVVYVGSNDGNVYALNVTTGALLWSYQTGNVVFSSPAVANGVVYVGSDDGNVYAFGLKVRDGRGNALSAPR